MKTNQPNGSLKDEKIRSDTDKGDKKTNIKIQNPISQAQLEIQNEFLELLKNAPIPY